MRNLKHNDRSLGSAYSCNMHHNMHDNMRFLICTIKDIVIGVLECKSHMRSTLICIII